MTVEVDALIVGAGVVGLAIARELAARGRAIAVIERERSFGEGVSARSSEVIHAGLYYQTGGLKARLCLEGRRLLYDYCAERRIPHRCTSKLVVAAEPAEVPALEAIHARARANGVEDLQWLSGAEAMALEPAVRAAAGLFVPVTGIIDSRAFMQSLVADLESKGGILAFKSPFIGAKRRNGGFAVTIGTPEGGEAVIRTDALVNAAGLGAQGVAQAVEGLPSESIPKLHLSRGCYYALSGASPVSRLVYPLPTREGIGVHLTLDLAGQARFGPDHAWLETIDYTMPKTVPEEVIRSIQHYLPGIKPERLSPAYAGIRPKVQGPGDPPADFIIEGPARHGLAGFVTLYGIESPGITASLAIGRLVASLLGL
jgi:L-2-hydroxyglutarate oxidase LhgO